MVAQEYLELRKYEISTVDKLWEFLVNNFSFIKVDFKDKNIDKYIEETHLFGASQKLFSTIITILIFSLLLSLLFFIATLNIFYFTIPLLAGVSIIAFLLLHLQWKYSDIQRKKEAQLLPFILYMAMYMRYNPNLEKAFLFALEHINPPLKLDLMKLYWNVSIGRYKTLKEALDDYIKRWQGKADYFVNSLILLESLLYEPSEERRKILLDKAVEEMLEGLYDKMMEYAVSLKNPIEVLYMLGMVLPMLTLTLVPIIGSLLTEAFPPIALILIYDVLIPLAILIIGKDILRKRPVYNTYEDTYIYNYLKKKGKYFKFTSILAGIFVFWFLLILLSSLKININDPNLASILISIFFIIILGLSISYAFIFYYNLVKGVVERTEKLLSELPSILIQLANRLSEGIPPEFAFYEIYLRNKNKEIGKFFGKAFYNVKFLGMSLEQAIFDKENGALLYYPSSLLKGVMEIFVENIKKGSEAAAKVLAVIAQYMIYLQRVERRIKDLLAETLSSMNLVAKFVAPLVLGIIIGMDAMMIAILLSLGKAISALQLPSNVESYVPLEILYIFSVQKAISPAILQLAIGFYLILLVILLSYIINGIENGLDKFKEKKLIGYNLLLAVVLYSIVAATASMFLWNLAKLVTSVV